MKKSILAPPNCWRTRHVDQLSLLIDAHAYFRAFLEVARQAKSSIVVVGWEIDARIKVDPVHPESSQGLRDYFNELCSKAQSLKIHLYSWKASFYLRFGRERMDFFKWKWHGGKRIQFKNNRSPFVYGSFHEKISIIDQDCAFIGGIDLGKKRWDTPHHHYEEPSRKDWNGKHYHPIHDVQFIVRGEIIDDLYQFIQERVGYELSPVDHSRPSKTIWPKHCAPQIEDVTASISRTSPEDKKFEIESLYFNAIQEAQDYILIENQYFSHQGLVDALCAKLKDPHGPQVIIILPYYYRGDFERATYLTARNEALIKLRAADIFERLEFVYPSIRGNEKTRFIVVHSKYMVVDNALMTMGSANLNYRSMRVDREVNLSLESLGDLRIEEFIFENVCLLLSEHLGIYCDEFKEVFKQKGQLLSTVRHFKGVHSKTLKDIPLTRLTPFIKFLASFRPLVDIKHAIPKRYVYSFFGLLIFVLLRVLS